MEIIGNLGSRYYLGAAKKVDFNLDLARVLASKLEITGPNQIFPRTHDGIFLGQKRLKGNRVKKRVGKTRVRCQNFKQKGASKRSSSPGAKDPFQFPLKFSNRVRGRNGRINHVCEMFFRAKLPFSLLQRVESQRQQQSLCPFSLWE